MPTDKIFDLNRIDAIKVQFKNGIFEDDFPERGMKAWLTKIEFNVSHGCYKLYFDFTEFEEENEKYFTADYYDTNGVACLTAKEKGLYNPKYSVYFGDTEYTNEENNALLCEHLQLIP